MVEIDNLTKKYGDFVAVDGLSLQVNRGEIYAFLGLNGAGKTTTIRMIMSILFPDDGELRVLGHGSALDAKDRIGYLPGAAEFLTAVHSTEHRVLLVTNSHPETLALKDAVTGLADYFDGLYSSHAFGHAKESQSFWAALQDEVAFDARTTLFVDDSEPVLQSAADYGVGMLLRVTRPDTSAPTARGSSFHGVEGVRDMLP